MTDTEQASVKCSSAGYWHVSFPTPIDLKPEVLKQFQKAGFPVDVDAPTGGRAMLCRSTDEGVTWSRPMTMIDTAGDDRHPVIVELSDQTLVAVFFVIDNWYGYSAPPVGRNKNSRVASARSQGRREDLERPGVHCPRRLIITIVCAGSPLCCPTGVCCCRLTARIRGKGPNNWEFIEATTQVGVGSLSRD